MYPKVFVINLKRSLDRKKHMQALLDPLPLEYEFVEAVDASDLTDEYIREVYDDAACQKSISRSLGRSEVACALSHLKAWRLIKERDLEYALILEDDVVIEDSEAFLEILNLRKNYPEGWDTILMGSGMFPRSYPALPSWFHTKKLYKKYKIARLVGVGIGAFAYLVTRTAIHQLLQQAQPLYLPIDVYTGNSNFINFFAISPRVVSEDAVLGSLSTLDEDRLVITDASGNYKASALKIVLEYMKVWVSIKVLYYQYRRAVGSFRLLSVYYTKTLKRK